MSQRFITEYLPNDSSFLSEAQTKARAADGLTHQEKNCIDLIFASLRNATFIVLQAELELATDKVQNIIIKSGAITHLIPKFTPKTLEKLFLRAAATSDIDSLDILTASLDPESNGRRFFGTVCEAFADAATRDDINVMQWLWELTEWSKNLIRAHDYFAFNEACATKATNAVLWMYGKSLGDLEMTAAMNKVLRPEEAPVIDLHQTMR